MCCTGETLDGTAESDSFNLITSVPPPLGLTVTLYIILPSDIST